MTSVNSVKKYWLIGMYFPVMALNAYWAVKPPKNAAKGANVPLHV